MSVDWKKYLVPLREVSSDTERIRKEYFRNKAETAVKNLKKNEFDAYYTDNRTEAGKLLLSLVPEGATVGCGDSHTLFALDIEEGLRKKGCTVIAHVCARNRRVFESETGFQNREEARAAMREILQNYLVSDVFLLGANAVTMDGQIVNVDGRGNRIAGSIYGPDRIIVIAGVNKLVPDVEAGRQRVGFTAAPMNHLKYGRDGLPCLKAGVCLDCRHPERACHITSIIHRKPQDSDFHVILVGEELGF
ncbi:lactate utilization protein [Lacrimispora sp. NSJ-141]|uniref:Lactate utilization protein n=1 Tax=Lientehia hominis TaxID=2897778 RepID=A0AAP2RIL7_9FIRM|nr:lactate utilization protein [Lientehia hominis]MCD2492411.1 lactate utilization protein [Lientehia hominis]